MKKRKLLLSTLFLASALTLITPSSAQANDPQGGGEGRERPRWPPIRNASETYVAEDSIQNNNNRYSVQGWWDYLVKLLT